MAALAPAPKAQFFDANGAPLVGGKLYSYSAGTTTPLVTYTDQAGTSANTNPVILDARGEANVWLGTGPYKLRLTSATDVDIWTVDDIYSEGALSMQELLSSSGSSLVGFIQAGTGATSRTVQSKLRDVVSVLDFGADPTGAIDSTTAFQAAIMANNTLVPPGNYTLTGNISIPGNRRIVIDKNAIVTNTGGRFTAENVTNVEWQIDGWLRSVAMATAPSKLLWTATANERGFIEFAQDYVAGQAASGFAVHGTGKVSGDWTGTPNVTDYATIQNNRKGIACWNAKNVLVQGLEIFGFQGEAVYASFFDAASHNIVFENNNVHDTRMNALNFNNGANGGGCFIRNNRAVNCYQVEMATGECSGNYIENTVSYGIFLGNGTSVGPVVIRNNVIKNSGASAIAAINNIATPTDVVVIEDNLIVNSGQYGIYANSCNQLTIKNNVCSGYALSVGAYGIGVENVVGGLVSNNTISGAGGFAVGPLAVAASCFDVCVDSTNRYIGATGTAPPDVDGGVVSVASAATITLPPIGKSFLISGTTNITSIVATGNNGREVRLIFAGALTFTDGSNLKLAGNFVTTADDVISLLCDGTNWYEISRSVN